MTTCFIKRTFTYVFLVIGFVCYSQTDFESFGESEFAVNHKFSQDYKVNFKVGTRYYLYQNDRFYSKIRQLDVAHFSTFNITFNHSLSFGIQYRNRDWFDNSGDELRLTQQFNYTKKRFNKRFGHRVRIEERIFDASTTIRTRYRFALDLPLNGERLDIGEAYMVSSMEMLWSMDKRFAPELDHRTTLQLGYQLTKNFKLQAGIQYRFESLNINTQQQLFVLSSGILKI